MSKATVYIIIALIAVVVIVILTKAYQANMAAKIQAQKEMSEYQLLSQAIQHKMQQEGIAAGRRTTAGQWLGAIAGLGNAVASIFAGIGTIAGGAVKGAVKG